MTGHPPNLLFFGEKGMKVGEYQQCKQQGSYEGDISFT